MFKSFFWKEWRESYPVVVLPLLIVVAFNLYVALRLQETPEFQRNVMCFFVWPGFTIYLVYLLFYRETEKETLEFLFSKPLAKHAIWLIKVSCGLIYILFMCLLSLATS